MMQWWRWYAVAAGGVLVGALGVQTLGVWNADATLARQKAELERLSAELRDRQSALEDSQARVTVQAQGLRQTVVHAGELADQILAAQGSAVDRLKKVIATVRELRDELKALPAP